MNTMTLDTYRQERRKDDRLPARYALAIARAKHRDLRYEWDESQVGFGHSLGVARAAFEQDGFDIEVNVSYEDAPDPTYSETSDDTGIRNPHFRYNGEWQDYGNRHQRYIQLEGGDTVRELAGYYHKAGDSRNVAWERARKSLASEVKVYVNDLYTQYAIRVTASVDGEELGVATLNCVDIGDVWGEEFHREIEGVLSDTDMIGEAIEEARENLAPAVEKEREKLARMEALTT